MGIFPYLSLFSRFLIGTVFLLAGLAKLPRRREFERIVVAYEIIPVNEAQRVARWLPWAEIGAGGLLMGRFHRPAQNQPRHRDQPDDAEGGMTNIALVSGEAGV
jgi:hypothetical protein